MNEHSWLHYLILIFCLACLSNESVAPQSDPSLEQKSSPFDTVSQARQTNDSPEKDSDDEQATIITTVNPMSNSEAKSNVLQTTIELYEGCKDRLELPESDNECEQDADCSRGGCGSELCIPTQLAKTMGSTCEVRPCFATLRSCGCQAGKCQWTLKEGIILQP